MSNFINITKREGYGSKIKLKSRYYRQHLSNLRKCHLRLKSYIFCLFLRWEKKKKKRNSKRLRKVNNMD